VRPLTLTGQSLNTPPSTLLRGLARRRCPARWICGAGHPCPANRTTAAQVRTNASQVGIFPSGQRYSS